MRDGEEALVQLSDERSVMYAVRGVVGYAGYRLETRDRGPANSGTAGIGLRQAAVRMCRGDTFAEARNPCAQEVQEPEVVTALLEL